MWNLNLNLKFEYEIRSACVSILWALSISIVRIKQLQLPLLLLQLRILYISYQCNSNLNTSICIYVYYELLCMHQDQWYWTSIEIPLRHTSSDMVVVILHRDDSLCIVMMGRISAETCERHTTRRTAATQRQDKHYRSTRYHCVTLSGSFLIHQ